MAPVGANGTLKRAPVAARVNVVACAISTAARRMGSPERAVRLPPNVGTVVGVSEVCGLPSAGSVAVRLGFAARFVVPALPPFGEPPSRRFAWAPHARFVVATDVADPAMAF